MAKISIEEYKTLKRLEGDSDDWKWLVRNSAGSDSEKLYVYSEKPYKDYDAGVWTDGNRDFILGSRAFIVDDYLFQFIQWEDKEPYSITGLMEEYESGKSEAKILESDYDKVIDELTRYVDQPEEYVVIEKPAIPQFVANWIEGNKQFEEKWNDYSKEDAMNDTIHFTIYGLFADYPATNSDVELRKPVLKWLSVDRGNYFKLVNAVRYGYEVEEEPKYFAKIKGHENIVSDNKYWNYCITDEGLDIGDNKVHADVLAEYVLNATKDEWENLGINDDNANFVEVGELEE